LSRPVRAGGEPLAGISLPMPQARIEHLIGFPEGADLFVDGALRPPPVSLDLGSRTRRRQLRQRHGAHRSWEFPYGSWRGSAIGTGTARADCAVPAGRPGNLSW